MIRYSLIFISFFLFSFSVFVTHSVRLLSGVNAQVALQGLQVAEAGATGVARVRLLPGMDQNVGPEVGNLKPGQSHTVSFNPQTWQIDAMCQVWHVEYQSVFPKSQDGTFFIPQPKDCLLSKRSKESRKIFMFRSFSSKRIPQTDESTIKIAGD